MGNNQAKKKKKGLNKKAMMKKEGGVCSILGERLVGFGECREASEGKRVGRAHAQHPAFAMRRCNHMSYHGETRTLIKAADAKPRHLNLDLHTACCCKGKWRRLG